MNTKEKILIIIMIAALIISIGFTYYKTMFKKNFEVFNTEPDLDIQDNE